MKIIQILTARDGEACAADLVRVFGISRMHASQEIGKYKKIWKGVKYSGPAKRYITWANFSTLT